MADFPTTLRVGPHDFAVENWDPAKAAAAHRYGECDNTAKTIRVDCSYAPRKIAETFIHEVLHAIYTEWVIKDTDDEERTVDMIAGALVAAWRDNPQAFDWLRSAILGPQG